MAADYAGAIAAIKAYFAAAWASATDIRYVNDSIDAVGINGDGSKKAWVFFETVNSGSRIEGFGSAGNNTVIYFGLIKAHVFVPVDSGIDDGYAKAIAAGEVFRNKLFYDQVTAGSYVRTGYRPDEPPRIDEGDASSDDGQWFTVTATIPFEFWTRA